jgi:light-harvesting complex I chlorophyll a/b binding protein 1
LQLSLASASLSFTAPAPMARPVVSRASPVDMKVQDLVGGINDPIFGGTPEGKIFDPLNLGADTASLYRRRCVEIKHGRVCMMAFLGMTVGPNEVRHTASPLAASPPA